MGTTVNALYQITTSWALLPTIGAGQFLVFLIHEILDFLANGLVESDMLG